MKLYELTFNHVYMHLKIKKELESMSCEALSL